MSIGLLVMLLYSCKKNDGSLNSEPVRLVFKLKFDSTQTRLNNIGQPSNMQQGRAGQSPKFNNIGIHYIEITPNALTPLGNGAVLYKAPETTIGGSTAIEFDKSIKKGEQGDYFALKISEIPNGTYEYIRVSLAYQNYDINFLHQGTDYAGTVASFIGYNTFIKNHTVKALSQTLNANKLQGYWAFETNGQLSSGQAPAGATTVPNPIFATSPIPQGSCVVTAAFVDANGNPKPLIVKGGLANDVNVLLSLSTNKSFEWNEIVADNKFEPTIGESVVDMGIRGLKPVLQ
jgi:hypothetical protein